MKPSEAVIENHKGKYKNPMLAAAIFCVCYPEEWASACMGSSTDYKTKYEEFKKNGPPKAPWTVCEEKSLKWPGIGPASLAECKKLFASESFIPLWRFLR